MEGITQFWNGNPMVSVSKPFEAPVWKEFRYNLLEDIVDEIMGILSDEGVRVKKRGLTKFIRENFPQGIKWEEGCEMFDREMIEEVVECLTQD